MPPMFSGMPPGVPLVGPWYAPGVPATSPTHDAQRKLRFYRAAQEAALVARCGRPGMPADRLT